MAAGVTSPNELHDPVAIALDVGARLDRLRVEWLTGGSLASSVHGEPRATQDVDMVVALRPRHVKPLWEALRRDYYVDVDEMRAAVRTPSSFNAVHFASAIKVDFFVAGDDPFEAERLANRQRIETPGAAIARGSSYLVIGRPITQAADPVAKLRAIAEEIQAKN